MQPFSLKVVAFEFGDLLEIQIGKSLQTFAKRKLSLKLMARREGLIFAIEKGFTISVVGNDR